MQHFSSALFRFSSFSTSLATVALLSLGPMAAAEATTIVLDNTQTDFADGFLNDGDTVIAGGITLLFSNVLALGGGGAITVDDAGIFFGDLDTYAGSFDVEFSGGEFNIDQYSVGFHNPGATGGFSIAGSNGTSGSNDMSTVGIFAFDMGAIPVITNGGTYTFMHTINVGNLSQLNSLELSVAAVPLPGAVWLMGSALLGMIGYSRRRMGGQRGIICG